MEGLVPDKVRALLGFPAEVTRTAACCSARCEGNRRFRGLVGKKNPRFSAEAGMNESSLCSVTC
jgi:hypothetical protein